MAVSHFSKEYQRLNKEQKKAVDSIEGPVIVIAGPGTGKTQILTLRIANILKLTDTPPDAILALTFTEAGVYSMRSRLVDIIGSDAYRVRIHTFHGFCNEVIQEYPDSFPAIIGASHIHDIEKIQLLEKIIKTGRFSAIKPLGRQFYYVNEIRRQIADLKRENITPKEFSKIVKGQKESSNSMTDRVHTEGQKKGKMRSTYTKQRNRIQKNTELARVYTQYQKELKERHLYDYEDMIVEVVRALKTDQELLLSLQEAFLYLLADEHQDANNAQNRLLELLASFHKSPNLFIVGDEKQAIFRFQGASLENFLYFKKRFPDAVSITLSKNYRSQQSILDAAHSIITSTGEASELRIPLVAHAKYKPAPIVVRAFQKPSDELLFLIADVEKKIAQGAVPDEIAILYRNNRDGDELGRLLEKTEIPFVVESDKNILFDQDIRKLVKILTTLAFFGDEEHLPGLLHISLFEIDPADTHRILAHASRSGTDLYSLIRSKSKLKRAGVKEVEKVTEFYKTLVSWKRYSENRSVLEAVELVLQESGLLTSILGDIYSDEKLEKLQTFFSNIAEMLRTQRDLSILDLINHLALLEEYGIQIKKRGKGAAKSGVRLMTVHSAKGLEFDYVYIIHARDGRFGGQRNRQIFATNNSAQERYQEDIVDDERRLFYVALTRARFEAFVSYAKYSEDGTQRLPSRFIEEIANDYKDEIEIDSIDGSDKGLLFSAPKKNLKPKVIEREYIQKLFLEQGLSVTALNNYLSCPWKYFYSSLLRIPQAPTRSLLYGNAVHEALRQFFNKFSEKDPGVKFLLNAFETALENEPLEEGALRIAKERGKKALTGYYKRWCGTWNQNVRTEEGIEVIEQIERPDVKSLVLRGKLDKIEFIDDSNVIVVDYKTGKPKSRRSIEGKTKDGKGDYKRQLVFYKLLLMQYRNGRWKMKAGEIDFVEPNDSGNYKKEQFLVDEKEVDELVTLIGDVAQEIYTLSFWGSGCGEKDCLYCELREIALTTE